MVPKKGPPKGRSRYVFLDTLVRGTMGMKALFGQSYIIYAMRFLTLMSAAFVVVPPRLPGSTRLRPFLSTQLSLNGGSPEAV
jgi:hypothetical protein